LFTFIGILITVGYPCIAQPKYICLLSKKVKTHAKAFVYWFTNQPDKPYTFVYSSSGQSDEQNTFVYWPSNGLGKQKTNINCPFNGPVSSNTFAFDSNTKALPT